MWCVNDKNKITKLLFIVILCSFTFLGIVITTTTTIITTTKSFHAKFSFPFISYNSTIPFSYLCFLVFSFLLIFLLFIVAKYFEYFSSHMMQVTSILSLMLYMHNAHTFSTMLFYLQFLYLNYSISIKPLLWSHFSYLPFFSVVRFF